MEEITDVPDEYQTSWIAELIHKLPHYDVGFQRVNATFDLHDRSYVEVSYNCYLSLFVSSVDCVSC